MEIDTAKIFAFFGGKKFFAFLVCALAIKFQAFLGLSHDDVLALAGLAATYIFGQSAADGLSKGATSSVVQSRDDAARQEQSRNELTIKTLENLVKSLAPADSAPKA